MYLVKKCLQFAIALLLPVLVITNCSNDKNSVGPEEESQYIYVHWNNDSVKVNFKDLATIDVDGEKAIQLSTFITRELIEDTTLIIVFTDKNGNTYEGRELYSYQVAGEDGFSASVKGYLNNCWEHMGLGYIMKDTRDVIFPDNAIDLPGGI